MLSAGRFGWLRWGFSPARVRFGLRGAAGVAVMNGLWAEEALEVIEVLPDHLQRAVRRRGERSGAFRVGEHVDGVLGELVGHWFGRMVGAWVEPPRDPVAHADDRQRRQSLVPRTELSL